MGIYDNEFIVLLRELQKKLNNFSGGGGGSTYSGTAPSNITVGGIPSGTNLTGKNFNEIIQQLTVTYINPSFSSQPTISGQATTVETGTTLSGSKTYLWAINAGSGVVPTVDVYDNTAAATLLAGTPNDGTQAVTINTIPLNTNGATQSWKLIGNNTSPTGTFNSNNFVVTSRFITFFGSTSATPVNSAQARALPQTSFYTGAGNITLNTGSTLIKFGVALPPGITLISAIDLDASNASVNYVLIGTITVVDAGGTNRTYNYYEANVAIPYSSSHRHFITTS